MNQRDETLRRMVCCKQASSLLLLKANVENSDLRYFSRWIAAANDNGFTTTASNNNHDDRDDNDDIHLTGRTE